MASFPWKVIRGVFGLGERLAPGLAGRAAFALFSITPSRRSMKDGERQAVARAENFMQGARHHRLKTRSGCVVVHEFRPDGGRPAAGSVLVLHGWRSRTEYMAALIEGHRRAGFRVFSLDLPGHGQSPGRRLTLPMAVEAVGLVAQWFGPFDSVVGHSFGGAVAINAIAGSIASHAPLPAERLVLIAAPNAISDVLSGFGRMINLGPRSYAAMEDKVERLSGRTLEDFTGARLLASLSVPTLVVHAPDDREVPADDARAYAGAGPHVSIHWADGLGHRRILSSPQVVERVVGFLTERAVPVDIAVMPRSASAA